ncbi:YbhB/YbcL family Raf kinase inhibitor-like protein [Streptomyces hainanensis]|nr:YbhB/YbcL family Raf kinase inhibitor-like protein [Streptomyces hainanensis]
MTGMEDTYENPAQDGLDLSSPAFEDRTPIPPRFTAGGGNVSPPLSWTRPPPGTQELALLCEDPDAPSGTFVHWLVTGIDAGSRGVAEGDLPPGGRAHANTMGDHGWDGPSPPVGDAAHRYRFRLYAMPFHVPLPDHASAVEVHRALDDERLAESTLTGLYQR